MPNTTTSPKRAIARSVTTPAFSRRDALRWLGLAGAGAMLPALPGLAWADAATRPAKTATPTIYPFKIGSLDAVVLSDGGGSISPIHPLFAPEATEEQLNEVLKQWFLSTETIDFYFNVLLVRIGGELVLFDTGSGGLMGPNAGKTSAHLRAAGYEPGDVSAIFITHAHGDHLRHGSTRYFVAEPGVAIARHRLGTDHHPTPLKYGEQLHLGATTISLHPAGHILGSAQLRLRRGFRPPAWTRAAAWALRWR